MGFEHGPMGALFGDTIVRPCGDIRATGAILLTVPPGLATVSSSRANVSAVQWWGARAATETEFENAVRRAVYSATLRRDDAGEVAAAWRGRLLQYYDADAGEGNAPKRAWMVRMAQLGYLPPIDFGAVVMTITPEEATPAVLSAEQTALVNTGRRAGESDAAWQARVQAWYLGADGAQRAWIDRARAGRQLPYAPGVAAPVPPGAGPRVAADVPRTPAPPGGTPAAPGMTPAQIAETVTTIIGAASGTVLALVSGALAADREAREATAREQAARIAAADNDGARAAIGAEAAANALGLARTAALTLAQGDRALATSRLSTAQGHLAAAQAAVAYFSRPGARVPPALDAAVRDASREIARVAGLIETSALPLPNPTALNPYVYESRAPSGWAALSTPAKLGVGAFAAAALAVIASAVRGR